LRSQHKPTASPPKLPIHRSETRTNGKDFDLPIETRANSEKLQLSEQELKRTGKNSNSPNKTQTNGEKPQSTERKLKRTVKNVKLPIKPQTNGKKRRYAEWKLKRSVENAENGCTSTQPRKNLRNFKNSRCGWETGFTRPHGGRLMILPVDSNARVLPCQRYLPLYRLCSTLASILHTSILLNNLKKTEWCRCGRSRSDAQVSDGITKTLREES